MIVNMVENPNIQETKITIECNKADSQILKIISLINNYENNDKKIIGISKGETYCIEQDNILYFETVDRKTFCYTADGVYEIALKLYEIEEKYENTDYIRISKSSIVNLNKIKSIRPDFGGKIFATMENSMYCSSYSTNDCFTDICIKKLAYTKRLAIFMFPFLAIITAFAVKCGWFPVESIGAWVLFIGIFIACFVVSTILFEIHFRITGDKYTGILNEYKNKKK